MGKNQHYIPQFYQKAWSDSENKIWRYNKEKDRYSHVAIRRNGSGLYTYEPDINSPTNLFEQLHGERESALAPKYERLLQDLSLCTIASISSEQASIIRELCACLVTRHVDYVYDNSFLQRVIMGFTIAGENSGISRDVEQRWLLNSAACGCYDVWKSDVRYWV